MARLTLPLVIDRLKAHHGVQKAPRLNGPWEMILWENIAYLADDDRRQQAFATLKKTVGTKPEQILSASDDTLLGVTGHGILAEQFVAKLRKCATIALEDFDGDLREVLQRPFAKARNALKKFPGIGESGADKILLFTRSFPLLPLDSNGLRVLVRLGFAVEQKSYAKTYQMIQSAVAKETSEDFDWLMQAHMLLRRHGQDVCKRTKPLCEQCPLAENCVFAQQSER